MTLYQGDNTQAFGGNFVRIPLRYLAPDGTELPLPPISKAEFRSGCVKKVIENPVFPLYINFTEEESAMLSIDNKGYLAVWDMSGKKKTPDGVLEFSTKPQRV